ncbi:unnamed protein product [Gongylonema pulchrum]|uniref:Uncharacterized protein n=1 Tax=Gongylonema pulchrum TaxID=637853 RepID=A0A3P6STQ7_9BILA|nr:unnamed protein product [Gongylonema pulchrum]
MEQLSVVSIVDIFNFGNVQCGCKYGSGYIGCNTGLF